MSANQFERLLDFLDRLDQQSIHHRLSSFRPDSICVEVTVPGERWEVHAIGDDRD